MLDKLKKIAASTIGFLLGSILWKFILKKILLNKTDITKVIDTRKKETIKIVKQKKKLNENEAKKINDSNFMDLIKMLRKK